jgi:DNA-binding NtrC family response regulator
MVVINGPLCQRIREMGLILWIDENIFATSLLEKIFKRRESPFYTLSKPVDFIYLIDDLKPQILVIDSQTAEKYFEEIKSQFSQSENLRSLPVILVDHSDKLDFIQNKVGLIERPFDPFQIPSIIEDILQSV